MSGPKTLLVVSVAASLLMTGVGMVVAMLPQRVLDLSGSLQSVGYLASCFALSYLLVQLPVGRLADRLGAKPFLVLGYVTCGAAGLLFFFAASAEAIFVGRFVQGLGEAPIWALGPALLSLAYPRAKGRVIGIYNAAIHSGLAVGPLLGIVLSSSASGRLPFLIFAGLCLIGGAIVLLLLRPAAIQLGPQARRSIRLGDMARLLSRGNALLSLQGVLLYGAGYGVFVSVLPATLTLTKDFGQAAVGVFFTLFYVAVSVAQIVAGPLSDRHGRAAFMTAGLAMAAVGLGSFSLTPFPWVYGPLALASLGLGVFHVAAIADLSDSVPASLRATASGSFFLSWGLGYFLGPLAVGALTGPLGPEGPYRLLALLFAVAAAAVIARRSSSA